jgi:hypothetical protein
MKTLNDRKKSTADDEDVMKPHYDFSKGEKPNYAKRFPDGAIITVTGTNGKRQKRLEVKSLVVLDPDVSKVFHDGRSVNTALRHLIAALPKKSLLAK